MSLFNRKIKLPFEKEYFQSVLAGSESGVATTSAIIIGLAATQHDFRAIATSAIIILFIQAFNAAASRYSSLKTEEEIEGLDEIKKQLPFSSAIVQFFFHMGFGLIPLFPLWLYRGDQGVLASAALTVMVLVGIAAYKVRYIKKNVLADGAETVLVGVLVMLVGLSAGLALEFITTY